MEHKKGTKGENIFFGCPRRYPVFLSLARLVVRMALVQ
jgi:hypothetical protein